MPSRELRRIAAARTAVDDLSEEYTSPRTLEADLDVVFSAFLRLPPESLGLTPQDAPVLALCDLLEEYSDRRLVSEGAVESCHKLEELTQIADYDVSDEEKFSEQAGKYVAVIKEELEKFLTNLENKIAQRDG